MKRSLPWKTCLFVVAGGMSVSSVLAQDDLPATAGDAYSSQLQPPPHPELLPQAPMEYEQKNGVWKVHRTSERIIEKDTAKPVEMKKVKFGADVSEPTGVFKSSLLDTDLALAEPKKNDGKAANDGKNGKAEKSDKSDKTDKTDKAEVKIAPVNPMASARLDEIDKNAAPAQNLGLSLATSPAPAASPAAVVRP